MRTFVSGYVARRLSLSAEGGGWSPPVVVSVVAVALSLSVMLASVCIVLGFKAEITAGIVGFNSHLAVVPPEDSATGVLTLTPSLREVLDNEEYVRGYTFEVSAPAVLKTPTEFKGIYLRGIDGGPDSTFLSGKLKEGSLPDFGSAAGGILLSRATADALGVKAGSKLDTYFTGGDSGVTMRTYRVSGIYSSDFEYDSHYAYMSAADVRDVFGLAADEGSALRVTTSDFDLAPQYARQLNSRLVRGLAEGELYSSYRVADTPHQAAGYFSWLSLLDTNVAVILALMTAVSAMTLISAMLILIGEKERVVGVLRALGGSRGLVRRVFVALALRIGLTGMAVGNVLTLVFLWLEQRYHFVRLDAASYYMDFMPVSMDWAVIAAVNAGVLAAVFVLLLWPSASAARISPASSLRTQ